MKEEHKLRLEELIEAEVLFNQSLKKYTSFNIGGAAEVLIKPTNIKELKTVLTFLHQNNIKYWILGNGTNLLISGQGLDGVVLQLSNLNQLKFCNNQIIAQAGVKLPVIINKAAQRGLSGLEALAGLPASLGGAIISNAGANGVWIADVLKEVTILSTTEELRTYQIDELDFGYRNSSLSNNQDIIVAAKLDLETDQLSLIKTRIEKKIKQRKKSQPLSYPNAGCIFKNPKDDFAGRLIDQAGCKGLQVGDAQVSTKHANFIVNLGSATYDDVLTLIKQVENIVEDKFSVKLKREVVIYK